MKHGSCAGVAAYQIAVDNELDFDVSTFRYTNVGRSRHVGTDAEAQLRAWHSVRPSISYSYTHVRDLNASDSDAQLKNIPRHLLSAGISLEAPWRLNTFARVSRSAGGFLDNANLFPIDGRATIDVRISRLVGRQMLFVDVVNATNNTYAEYGYTLSDLRGRPAPYVYGGAQRAIRAGWSFGFKVR